MKKFPTVKLKRYNTKHLDLLTKDEQQEVIENYHSGQSFQRGIMKTYEKIKRYYYFPRKIDEITQFINNCPICARI